MGARIDPWELGQAARALAWALDHPGAAPGRIDRSFARAALWARGGRRARGVAAGMALAGALALAEHAARAIKEAASARWGQGSLGERSAERRGRERSELLALLGLRGQGSPRKGPPRL